MGAAMTAPQNDQPAPDQAAQPDGDTVGPDDYVKRDETDWKAEARKWEQRAKDNQKAAREFEQQRQAAMTDSERAVAEAEARGRTAAATEFGKRLARTEFDAAAARRNAEYDTAKALKYVDLAQMVGEDGEPDLKAIAAAVNDLIPEVSSGPAPVPSFDGGPRQTAQKPTSMSDLIRTAVQGGR